MLHELTTVFLWNDSYQEKTIVAASASSEAVEVYYALENRCTRHGSSFTASSHTWSGDGRRYLVEEIPALEAR